MPKVFLSPSVQQFNEFVNGGTEEQYMNIITDAIEPYLAASSIDFERNNPDESLSQAIAKSNASGADLHVAIHSNAAPESLAGKIRGTDVYYNKNSYYGKQMADITADKFREISQTPDKIQTLPTTTLAELRRTTAPAILIETAYHDNIDDANWIKENIDEIAKAIAEAIADYFGVPFVTPIESRNDFFVEETYLIEENNGSTVVNTDNGKIL